ncbi:unnamed protein product [Vitrella brassicaformis CCMP3155]|uniref:Uncharacterized protein n=1 Tax=Vitrella brassicaformis (strain CCMP3155) TaxID=1169540 RepID=A0A0G4G008_VITBC|nr:unnamed protein product [Vitrella brassicaformis CCMP3155]|eukprot:CEM20832.1 unnamed protein product [Vitrella brassicaformis CCMP3155]
MCLPCRADRSLVGVDLLSDSVAFHLTIIPPTSSTAPPFALSTIKTTTDSKDTAGPAIEDQPTADLVEALSAVAMVAEKDLRSGAEEKDDALRTPRGPYCHPQLTSLAIFSATLVYRSDTDPHWPPPTWSKHQAIQPTSLGGAGLFG